MGKERLALELHPNAPNPFNPSTEITYQIPETGHVGLVVYNSIGQQVRTLVAGLQAAGQYRVVWDGRDGNGRMVSTGIYLYRLVTQGRVAVRRMLLLK